MHKYAILALLTLAACGSEPEKKAPAADTQPKVQLALNWFPEAEHGGFYAAAVHGYYEAQGVAVEILGGGPDAPVIQRVATGAVAFGVRGSGKPRRDSTRKSRSRSEAALDRHEADALAGN